MIGSPLQYRSEPFDMAGAQRLNDLAGSRERIYYPMALTFVVVQVLAYVFAAVVLSQRGGRRGGSRPASHGADVRSLAPGGPRTCASSAARCGRGWCR